MEQRDVELVLQLLDGYLAKFDMAPAFTPDEVDHWLLSKSDQDQVVWTYVVEVSGGSFEEPSFPVLTSSPLGSRLEEDYGLLLLLRS